MKKLLLAIALGLSVQNSQAFYIEKAGIYYGSIAAVGGLFGLVSGAIAKFNDFDNLKAFGVGSLAATSIAVFTWAILRDRYVYNVISDSTNTIKSFQRENREVADYLNDLDFVQLLAYIDSFFFSNSKSQDPRIYAYESYVGLFRILSQQYDKMEKLFVHEVFVKVSPEYRGELMNNMTIIKAYKKAVAKIIYELTNTSDWQSRMANELARKKLELEKAQHQDKMDLERDKLRLEREKIEVQRDRNDIYRGKKV